MDERPKADWPRRDMLGAAWGIIANAFYGNWNEASPEWRQAAERWRDEYHKIIGAARKRDVDPSDGTKFAVVDPSVYDLNVDEL